MNEPLTIDINNVREVFAKARAALQRNNQTISQSVVLPKYEKVLGPLYRGRGRPRNKDYELKEINWLNLFQQKL